jgi:signal peptidase I
MLTTTSIPCDSAAFAELSTVILRAGKGLRFQARGASMSPLVRDGDVLLVQPADRREVRVGDVVLCSHEVGHVVVHRVVRRVTGPTGRCFVVQGDQVARPDGVIPGSQVYGRVVGIERAGVHIDTNWPAMRVLSAVAVFRSRWHLNRGQGFGLAGRLVRKLPGLSRYLA